MPAPVHTIGTGVFVGVIAYPAAYRRRARAVAYRATNATQIDKKKGR